MKGTDKFTQARVRAAGQTDRATQTSAHRWRRRRQHTVQYIEGQSEDSLTDTSGCRHAPPAAVGGALT